MVAAVVLVSELLGIAFAVPGTTTSGGAADEAQPDDSSSANGAIVLARAVVDLSDTARVDRRAVRRAALAAELASTPAIVDHARPELNRGSFARPELVAKPRAEVVTPAKTVSASSRAKASAAATTRTVHRGRNHVWIPSLGISRSVAFFPCSRSEPPANHVYRWGCAGRNNVYLLGHAYGMFKPIHDAYARGRLRKGMTVDYADSKGVVRRYAVVWWKVTAPTTDAKWAWAPQARPSLTLQTCVGKNAQDRLIIRLVQQP
jgi:hypothetical protein